MSEDDYGTLNGIPTGSIVAPVKRSQVYLATHDGEGRSLPYMRRSFISFTYGGKKIEDFNLLATISGDRLNRQGYANFEDTVTTYDNLDGQFYWATHYKANLIDFVLATDGIDLKMLDEFLYWFKAGTSRELILAEHPNRAIMARVSTPPQIDLLPFGHDVDITISSETYTTKTTLYKGEISLSLVMDEPHWYSLGNVLGKKTTVSGRDRYEDVWNDVVTGQEISIFASLDALKVLYEDGIPLGSMIEKNMLLGNGAYANVENRPEGKIWSIQLSESGDDYTAVPEPNSEFWTEGVGARIDGTITGSENPASAYAAGTYIGIVAGAIVNANDEGIETLSSIDNNGAGYFFYSGTAPSPTIISFKLTPHINENGYVDIPKNSYSDESHPYNEFIIESTNKQVLKFTTPNFFTSYNKAIKVFNTYVNSNNTWETVREALRDTVRHPKVREYAISLIEVVKNQAIGNISISSIVDIMKKILIGNGSTPLDVTFTFNSKTGTAIGQFKYYSFDSTVSSDLEEDVGDMLRSNYIIILDRNYPTSAGKIESWTQQHPEYSHKITHTVSNGLKNIQILYKNMYL